MPGDAKDIAVRILGGAQVPWKDVEELARSVAGQVHLMWAKRKACALNEELQNATRLTNKLSDVTCEKCKKCKVFEIAMAVFAGEVIP